MTVTGQVYRREQASDYQIFYLKNNSITDQEQQVQEPYLLIYDKYIENIRIGNTVEVRGKLSFFEEERNPGGFSQKAYYRCRKIAACLWSERGSCVDDSINVVGDRLDHLRIRWRDFLVRCGGEKEGGLLCAILLGDKRQMDAQVRELYQVSGIAHILAISGLHLSFVGLGFYRMVRRATGSYPLGGLIGIVFLTLYVLMVGDSVSAVRAWIMFCIRVGADLSGRAYDAPTSLAVAAAGVIAWRPLSFYDAGAQLSFGAVWGIVFLYPALAGGDGDREQGKKGGAGGRVKESLLASLCIQAGTLPALLYHYCEIPPYSLALNLVVIPLMSLVLAMGFAGSLLGLAWYGGGKLCLEACGAVLDFYEFLCRCISRLPGSRIIAGRPAIWGILVYGLCLAILCAASYPGKRGGGRPWLLALGGLALALACPAVHYRGLEVTFLDVGQGDGVFIRERGMACLVDGGSSDVPSVGKYRIEPFLKARGVSQIDYAFVTHGDSDHINGIQELIERMDVGVPIHYLVFPEQQVWDEKLEELFALAKNHGVHTAVIHQGQQLCGEELKLTCLAPDGGKLAEPGNGASLVLEASYGELELLLTGDVEGQGEGLLTEALEETGREGYEILKVAHHGSKNSTGDAFLDQAEPMLAVISAGRGNRYGHPHQETLERLKEHGTMVLGTYQSGAITLKTHRKATEDLKIIPYRGKTGK